MAQNLIAHYRFATTQLPESSNDDINARWLSTILDLDQQRHGTPLLSPRAEAERVQGCCRDQTLIAVGILRQHNIPARSRVGFADYLRPNSRVDHVVAECWLDDSWVRFDPGLAGPRGRVADPHDISISDDSPFLTAAAAWIGHRRHGRSIDDLGVSISPVEFTGAAFVLSYLIMDVAHRFGDELLLWDSWGAMPLPGTPIDFGLGDALAELVQLADQGDLDAENTLRKMYETDSRVHVGDEVLRFSPRGEPPVRVSLGRNQAHSDRAIRNY
ncbi:transglutaminase-like domain-containing protein [Micropruina sp.]|uniref:transglutaminase-like domain-containing protein n=1 Tax=Micropruina sp. TaxID=2737536 RepID=UPI0039E53A5F